MATETLSVKIIADAQNFSSALSKMSSDLNKVSKDFEGLNKLGDSMKNVGKKLTLGLTAPIAGVATASAKTAIDFESAMNQVSAISGATGTDLDKLSNLAKEMGSTTKFSATESAEALTYMGMAGWNTQSMVEGLPGVLSLAAAGGTDLATTSDIVTDGLTALGLTASDTSKFVDIMAATCLSSNTSIELMGETLKYCGPVAGSLGIEMTDLSLAIGLMGNAGIKGSMAGTALKTGLTNLISPTSTMKKAMDEYGISIVENADGTVNLTGTMESLRDKLGGLTETQQASALSAIFGKEAMSGWASIVNASETDFNNLKASIEGSDGAAQSMADTMMQGASGALTEMKSALEGMAITIGERLTPFIEKFADWISNLCQKFQELNPATQTLIIIITGVVAAIGPLLIIGGSLITLFANIAVLAGALGVGMGAIILPVVGVIAGITALIGVGVWLCQNWDTIKSKATEVWNSISDSISTAWTNITTWVSEGCSNIGQWISNIWNNVTEWTSNAWDTICNVVQVGIMLIGEIISAAFQIITLPFQLIWQNCSDFLINIWNNITTFLSGVWSSISSVCSSVWNSISSFLSGIWHSMSSVCSSVFNSIKTFIQTVWNGVKSLSSSVWNGIKLSLDSIWNNIKSTASSVFNGLKSSISNIWNSIKSTTSSVWNGIKSAISTPINAAKDAVSNAIEKIKGFLNVTLPFPKIKLPHFSFSGKFSLNPPSVPKFSVSWYSKGAIFKRPTVLGGMGVGDAHNGIGSNAEAILPINKLPELLGLDKQSSGNLSLNIENFNNNREQDIKELVEEIAFYLKRKNISIGGV